MTNPFTGLDPVAAVMEAAHAHLQSPASEQLAEKFAALMKRDGHSGVAPMMESSQPNALGQVLETQEAAVKRTVADMESFQQRIHGMSAEEVAAEQMRLTVDLAIASVYFTFASETTQETNKGMQTLMKNQ
jgi:type III secretion inner rod protein HrpB2